MPTTGSQQLPAATQQALQTTLGIYRASLTDVMEELGALASQLREASADLQVGNLPGATTVVDDAIDTSTVLAAKFNNLTADLAKWYATAAQHLA